MKQTLLFALAFVVIARLAQAQDLPKNQLQFSTGVGIPVGDFGDDNVENEDSGLAKPSLMLDLSYAHFFNGKVGILIGLRSSAFAFNEGSYEKAFKSAGINANVATSSYSIGTVYLGVAGRHAISEELFFTPKLAIGYSSTRLPDVDIVFSDGVSSGKIHTEADPATAVSIIIGGGLSYEVSEKIGLSFNIDYFSSKPKFTVEQTATGNGQTEKASADYSQKIGAVTLNLGIAYKF